MPVSISVRLPENTARALDELATATERPRTYLILKALEAYLREYADYQLALDRLRDKDDPVISSAELRKRLGRKMSTRHPSKRTFGGWANGRRNGSSGKSSKPWRAGDTRATRFLVSSRGCSGFGLEITR
jgi:RHH-type rel operon transcriptional repressor/antitoxin RelB